jgi:hypothetical protein
MTPELAALYVAMIGAGSALITLGIRSCLKSNCTDVNICYGCIKYKRNDEEDPSQLEIQPVSSKI